MRAVLTMVMLLALMPWVSACGSDESGTEPGELDASAGGASAASDYRVVLANALTDTLRGPAHFGVVYETQGRSERFVIRLESDFDFAGGVVFARRDTTLPVPGTYMLDVPADSMVSDDAFILLYREGMLRDMRATSGTLALSTVTDTLIVGTFDARLRGRIAFPDRTGGADVHAVGSFRASQGLVGFVIGL